LDKQPPEQSLTRADFPDRGIIWLRWEPASLDLIAEKGRPVFLFVGDQDPTVAPFLRALLRAMPRNEKLRRLLHDEFLALFIESNATVPEELATFGAGSTFHVAILAPSGLTPLCIINFVHGNPDEVVGRIVEVLERLVGIWP
jgi:hypothetical protein